MRSAWRSTSDTGSGTSGRIASARSSDVGSASSSGRPWCARAPRPVRPSSAASVTVHSTRSSRNCPPRRGRCQATQVTTDSVAGAVPAPASASACRVEHTDLWCQQPFQVGCQRVDQPLARCGRRTAAVAPADQSDRSEPGEPGHDELRPSMCEVQLQPVVVRAGRQPQLVGAYLHGCNESGGVRDLQHGCSCVLLRADLAGQVAQFTYADAASPQYWRRLGAELLQSTVNLPHEVERRTCCCTVCDRCRHLLAVQRRWRRPGRREHPPATQVQPDLPRQHDSVGILRYDETACEQPLDRRTGRRDRHRTLGLLHRTGRRTPGQLVEHLTGVRTGLVDQLVQITEVPAW